MYFKEETYILKHITHKQNNYLFSRYLLKNMHRESIPFINNIFFSHSKNLHIGIDEILCIIIISEFVTYCYLKLNRIRNNLMYVYYKCYIYFLIFNSICPITTLFHTKITIEIKSVHSKEINI